MLATVISDLLEVKTEEVFIDSISLLTEEQHEKYRNVLNEYPVPSRWWIRTFSEKQEASHVKYISADNEILHQGAPANESLGVRPTLCLADPVKQFHLSDEVIKRLDAGDIVYIKDTSWLALDNDLCISENIIGKESFDKHSEYGLSYAGSTVQTFLAKWFKEQGLRTLREEVAEATEIKSSVFL